MKKLFLIILVAQVLFYSCKPEAKKTSNPLLSQFDTPFQSPPFSLVDTSHYIPAFEKGIADQQAEIDSIVNNPAEPTFENTILPYDNSGQLLSRVGNVFFALNSANTDSALQAIARIISPLLTKHYDNLLLNEKLFKRIKAIYLKKDNSNFDADQKRVIEKYYNSFVRNGADLNAQDKEKLRNFNQQIAQLIIGFDENHLAETNSNFKLVIDKKEDLEGLPTPVIEAAAETAKYFKLDGKWVFTLQKPSMIPFLQYAKNRSLREKIYKGYYSRGNNNDKFDNKQIMLQLMNLRGERARLLGFKTHADYAIAENMAKTPGNVYDFLTKLLAPAQEVAKKDCNEMQKIIDREGGKFKLDTWDWWYYAEKLKKEKFNLDEAEIKPYLALTNVRDGMFYVANKLYGISYTKITNIPVYDKDVETFEIKDADGKHLGILYLDYYPRPGKSSGAWCGNFRNASFENGKKIFPLTYIVCNFTKASGDVPALLTWDEATTLFHEFGHALHSLFSENKYDKLSGNLPNDMSELPSQFMENFAGQPEVLNIYAKHYKTGAVIPVELQQRLQKSLVFNEGFVTTEYIAASILDLDLHSFQSVQNMDIVEFEKNSMEKIKLMKEILPRYRTTYFSHLMGGYDAGYYVYLWAAVLDSDAFQAFLDSGDIYNKDIAARFKQFVLKEGGADEGMVQYKKFRGKDPSLDPLLKKRGLK